MGLRLVLQPRPLCPALYAISEGYGRSFILFYEAYSLEHGCSELRIDTNERNLAARAIYAKYGYQEIGMVPTVFNGIEGVNLVLLEKRVRNHS